MSVFVVRCLRHRQKVYRYCYAQSIIDCSLFLLIYHGDVALFAPKYIVPHIFVSMLTPFVNKNSEQGRDSARSYRWC